MTKKNSDVGVESHLSLLLVHNYVLKIGDAYKKKKFKDIPVYLSVIASLHTPSYIKAKTWWEGVNK